MQTKVRRLRNKGPSFLRPTALTGRKRGPKGPLPLFPSRLLAAFGLAAAASLAALLRASGRDTSFLGCPSVVYHVTFTSRPLITRHGRRRGGNACGRREGGRSTDFGGVLEVPVLPLLVF